MKGVVLSPFIEGTILLGVGLVFMVVAHVIGEPTLETFGNMVLGGGMTYLGLAQANKGA